MPELPEVETIKRNLSQHIIGKTISYVKILSLKNFIGKKEDIIGKKIVGVKRYGKVLVFELVISRYPLRPTTYLNCHFKMSGQMLFTPEMRKAVFKNKIPFTKGNIMPANTTRAVIGFKDGSGLFFNDLRKFGWLRISDKPLVPNGVDVLSKSFTPQLVSSLTRQTRKPVKSFLLDQDKIAGIGNIYANDSLYVAKIHPQRPANSLTKKEITRLYKSIITEIKKGVRDKGSSGADEAFILPDGSKGKHQRRFLVYQRERLPCFNCGTKIKRIKHNGRSSFFCPNCQRPGLHSIDRR